ncbi:LLM class F420-dependent oxidoreductase [uncultured Nocardioides sp.]|uniref:LLM class F420-dependent oxidoreductase n=1 Tax=uncultured Nocardioides sp. TaxID=198441 RepID=UPI000C5F8BEA|nr:LLM class F420-dependent oxidoreductase [uncultured Nocardioides sp.]MAO82066.1 LLM class F420-dependent oxidoreductase [Nocardioides sp.]
MSGITRWGTTIPLVGLPLTDLSESCRELEDLGYTDLWSAEATGTDGVTPLAVAAASTQHAHLGIAIASVFTRGPALLAQTAATLASIAPGRFTMGLGASSSVLVHDWNATEFVKPLSRCRDVLRFLRSALAGERVTQEYDTFRVDGVRIDQVPEIPPTLLLAGLRGRMLRLAGQEADGAILNWLSAEDVTRVAPLVHETGPREVVARLMVAPTAEVEQARATARRLIAAYLNVPVYREFHRWLGREELEPMWRLWSAGDRRGALDAIPHAVVDDLVLHGPPGKIREQIAAYTQQGVTVPISMLLPLEGVDPMQAARELAPR